ncbi:MAG: hypothetical protein IJD16_04140 [Desulfovibrio sp.]|nr:hypothetical protein [Desulfovibrio sp.]
MKRSSSNEKAPEQQPEQDSKQQDTAGSGRGREPWYAGKHRDSLFYLLIAVLLVEMIVSGVAFFYGLVHSSPEVPGGPPVARFPWLIWAVASVLAPVGLLLIVHLTGMWLSRTMEHDARQAGAADNSAGGAALHPRVESFYAMVRSAPTVVLLLGILLLGAALFFVDGAFSALARLSSELLPYLPWLAGSLAALLAVCFLSHRWFLYRQRRMEQEYAFRREVLERTGIVLMDRSSVALPQNEEQRALLGELPTVEGVRALPSPPPVLDVEVKPAITPDAGTPESGRDSL